MDRNSTDPAERFVNRLAAAARAEAIPQVDVAARVLSAVHARHKATVPAWDWSFHVMALASCAVALFSVVASADALGFLFDPLVALLSVYPDIQF